MLQRAYNNAGIPNPRRGALISQFVQKAPTPEQVSSKLIAEGLDTVSTDVEAKEWYANALDEMRTAHAAQALQRKFNEQIKFATQRRMPQYIAQAAEDLAAPFNTVVKALSKAAKSLPAGGKALDAETVIAHDAGAALTEARAQLGKLTPYAALHHSNATHGLEIELASIASIVQMPEAKLQLISNLHRETLNEGELEGTHIIRGVYHDLKDHGVDHVLINIARGAYKGVKFALAGPDELEKRRENMRTAMSRRVEK